MENFIFRAYNHDKGMWEHFSPESIFNNLDEFLDHVETGNSFFLYTGFQDKYDNPIFEDDYVLIEDSVVSIISFSRGSFIYKNGDNWYPLNTTSPDIYFEVVGDIFNPPER